MDKYKKIICIYIYIYIFLNFRREALSKGLNVRSKVVFSLQRDFVFESHYWYIDFSSFTNLKVVI